MFRFSFKKAGLALFSGAGCVSPRARVRAHVRKRERVVNASRAAALEVYDLCNLSVEMNWVIYWKTQSQEDWISTAYPRAPIHQVPINNLTIEF